MPLMVARATDTLDLGSSNGEYDERALGMQIAELWRYPVKSMAGEPLDEAWLGLDGIPGDRRIVVLDGEGEILSARTRPLLLRHRASIVDDQVLVDGLPWDSPEVAQLVR